MNTERVEETIRCSRVAGRKAEVAWVEAWFLKNGAKDVTLRRVATGGNGFAWIVRGTLPVSKLAEFAGLEAKRDLRKKK